MVQVVRRGTSDHWPEGLVPMAHGPGPQSVLRCGGGDHATTDHEGDAMETVKSQTWRVVMLLSALASLSLVLMAGRRW